jgi:hypothetical protein
LKVGYETEELLRVAGDGDEAAKSQVLSLLEDIQSRGDDGRTRQAQNHNPHKTPRRRPEPYPGAESVFATRPRSLSELSGRRQVPKLISANGMPFLRFKKPQSAYISRIIKYKANQKQKANDQLMTIPASVDWASDEDRWDHHARLTTGSEEPWVKEVYNWKQDIFDNLRRTDAKAKNMAQKMLAIVDQERELFEREKKKRKAEKNERTKTRKLGRGRLDMQDSTNTNNNDNKTTNDSLRG